VQRLLGRVARSRALGSTSIAMSAVVVVAGIGLHLYRSPTTGSGPGRWVALAGLVVAALAVHELGHALALARFAAPPDRFGILVRWLVLPGLFVNTSNAWMLARPRRMVVTAAGPWASLVAGALLELGSAGTGIGILHVAAGLSMTIGFFNLLPFLARMDGFWLLSDLLETADWRRARVGPLFYVLWSLQLGFLTLFSGRAYGALTGGAGPARSAVAVAGGSLLTMLVWLGSRRGRAAGASAAGSCQRERNPSLRSTFFMWVLTVLRLR
jgi:hypothetical protein